MRPNDRAASSPRKRALLARIFGEGENPLSWGFPIARLGPTRVRVHLLFVLFLLALLIFTLPGHQMGVVFVLPMLIALCFVVCAHELGHLIICRRLGGHVDEIMLWPLGGLSDPVPPHSPRALILSAMGGIFVNLLLAPLFAILVVAFTGDPGSLLFNPLSIAQRIGEIQLRDGSTPWWIIAIWSFYAVNMIVLLANLLPMFPLDGGRILQGIVWKSSGYSRSVWIAVHAGLVSAVVLVFVGAIAADGRTLLVLGIFGGLVCIAERRKLQFLKYAEMIPGFSSEITAEAEAQDERTKDDPEEIDRVLEKISSSGIGSLSRSERALLKRATENSRNSE